MDELTLRRTQLRANQSQRDSAVGTGRGFGGRGGYQERGGRGRGRGRGNNRNNRLRSGPTRVVDGRLIHSGSYSIDEYRSLTPAQREAVKALRRQMRQQTGGQNNPSWNDRRAGVNSITMNSNTIDSSNNDSGNQSQLNTQVSAITAPAGSVGSYLGNRRNNRNPSQSE